MQFVCVRLGAHTSRCSEGKPCGTLPGGSVWRKQCSGPSLKLKHKIIEWWRQLPVFTSSISYKIDCDRGVERGLTAADCTSRGRRAVGLTFTLVPLPASSPASRLWLKRGKKNKTKHVMSMPPHGPLMERLLWQLSHYKTGSFAWIRRAALIEN